MIRDSICAIYVVLIVLIREKIENKINEDFFHGHGIIMNKIAIFPIVTAVLQESSNLQL